MHFIFTFSFLWYEINFSLVNTRNKIYILINFLMFWYLPGSRW